MSANNLRHYFPVKDPATDEILEGFVDLSRSTGQTEITDWGVLYDRTATKTNDTIIMSGGRKVQPCWFLPYAEAAKWTVVFSEDHGNSIT
jgi:hypothetical protein